MSHEAKNRAAEMLAEAAEMDLALARRIHARAMAAEDDAALADLTRAQQRALRSMRQSLALEARLAEIRARIERARSEAARAEAQIRAETPRKADYPGLRRRADELQDAVGRVILRYTECEEEREALFDFLAELVVYQEPTTDFDAVTLDEQVAEFCGQFDIPPQLYTRWRELPPLEPLPEEEASSEEPGRRPAVQDTG